MPTSARGAELVLIRHAEVAGDGRLAGRRDVECVLPGAAKLAAVRAVAGVVEGVLSSPAWRCVATAGALFPVVEAVTDARLWEQDFGDWEGVAPGEVPDLGPLDGPALAAHRPPGGESFMDVVDRVSPVLAEVTGRKALVVHAGVVRAALAQVVGAGPALAFDVAPLSVTRITRLECGTWSVGTVNWRPE